MRSDGVEGSASESPRSPKRSLGPDRISTRIMPWPATSPLDRIKGPGKSANDGGHFSLCARAHTSPHRAESGSRLREHTPLRVPVVVAHPAREVAALIPPRREPALGPALVPTARLGWHPIVQARGCLRWIRGVAKAKQRHAFFKKCKMASTEREHQLVKSKIHECENSMLFLKR